MNDRDTFAAAALTGLLADDGDRLDHAMSEFTRRAYEWADAMLIERGVVAYEPTLTNVERSAIMYAIRFLQSVGNHDSLAERTLRLLIERTE